MKNLPICLCSLKIQLKLHYHIIGAAILKMKGEIGPLYEKFYEGFPLNKKLLMRGTLGMQKKYIE